MTDLKTSDFTWHGPVQGIELKTKDEVVFEANLSPGKDYKMPVDHPVVKSWKASGLIVPAKAVITKASKSTSSSANGGKGA